MIKRKRLIVASVLALTVVLMPHRVIAQPTPTPAGVATVLKNLNLTPDQQVKVDSIQASAADKIKAILGPEQLKQLGVISEAGRADPAAFATLNLSDEQKTKLNDVQLGVAQELFSVLSPEQQQKLIDEMMSRASQSQ